MPHDKKGRLVEVGDFVKVKPFNTPQTIVGRVSSVTPGTEACNARVEFQWQLGDDSHRSLKEDYTECRAMEIVLKGDGSEPVDQRANVAPVAGDEGDPTVSG